MSEKNETTDRNRETREQELWLSKGDESLKGMVGAVANRLIENEFRDPEEMQALVWRRVKDLLKFGVQHVPYYRNMANTRGVGEMDIEGLEDLSMIPLLSKRELRKYGRDLHAEQLPPGQKSVGRTASSGTTGQPVEVSFSSTSARMFGLLKQRELRWFRYNPNSLMAYIRPPEDFPDSEYDEATKTYKSNVWPYVGRWFHAGKSVAYDHTLPIDEQLEWLKNIQADYMIIESGALESLAFAQESRERSKTLKGIQAVATQLTAKMRRRSEAAFGLKIDQNYGLNEIGLVASRCPVGGRYHVHIEHCYVEIVDDEGRPQRPGKMGRILVTGLNNLAMPIIRYDTDDMAEVVEGPCPCGRTLPSFGKIMGRYRRTAYLPGNTWLYWEKFRSAIESMPPAVSEKLRQYQLHQFRDGGFEFRHVSAGVPSPEFAEYIGNAWHKAVASAETGDEVAFIISQVDEIPRGMGRKYQNFTSEFAPEDEDWSVGN